MEEVSLLKMMSFWEAVTLGARIPCWSAWTQIGALLYSIASYPCKPWEAADGGSKS